jgi:superfamily II DNA helicase RecQ
MAAARPTSLAALGTLYGVGARKSEEFGPTFLEALQQSGL